MALELASGPVKIAELCDRTVLNPDYTDVAFVWTGLRLFMSEISEFRLIGRQQVFDVELDDGSIVRASATSRFAMKSGAYRMAPELSPGDSLLPLYFGVDFHGYPTYKVPGKDVKQKIYRLMAEWKHGKSLEKGTEVKHIDGNRKNFHPDNLTITPNKRSQRKHKHKIVKAYEDAQKLLDECAAASPMMAEIAKSKRRTNHKVRRSTPGLVEPVYTASVRSMGSVSVSGVFLELPA